MGEIDVHEPARSNYPDGVDEIVDALEAVQGGGNGVLHRGFVRAISLNRQSLAVARIVRRRDIDRSNAGAGLAKQLNDGAPDAAGGTGHQGGATRRLK